jgi:pimeloyl-ACP methyl ester carboxylesterase
MIIKHLGLCASVSCTFSMYKVDGDRSHPAVLLTGWPGSFFEFYKVIPLLKQTGQFHIVAPSLPGSAGFEWLLVSCNGHNCNA